jgi:hypothetical protein
MPEILTNDELTQLILSTARGTIASVGAARRFHKRSTDMLNHEAAEDLARNLAQGIAGLIDAREDPDPGDRGDAWSGGFADNH